MTRLIDADELKKALKSNCDTLCNDKNTNWCERCCPLNDFEDLIDNAPTADDWQKYSDELWKNAYAKCKEDVIHRIAEQYSEHNELVPIWLSIGDIRGEKE